MSIKSHLWAKMKHNAKISYACILLMLHKHFNVGFLWWLQLNSKIRSIIPVSVCTIIAYILTLNRCANGQTSVSAHSFSDECRNRNGKLFHIQVQRSWKGVFLKGSFTLSAVSDSYIWIQITTCDDQSSLVTMFSAVCSHDSEQMWWLSGWFCWDTQAWH